MNANLILFGVPRLLSEIAGRVNELHSDLDITEVIYLENILLQKTNFLTYGYSAEYIADEVIAICETDNDDINIIICGHAMENASRYKYLEDRKVIVISVNGLRDRTINTIATLVVGSYVAAILHPELEAHDGGCSLNFSINEREVTPVVCKTCVASLGEDAQSVMSYLAEAYNPEYQSYNGVVLITHGCCSYGRWVAPLEEALNDKGIRARSFFYGYFPLSMLFLSRFFRGRLEVKLVQKYLNIVESHPERPVSVIAHSFGTLLIALVMKGDSRIKFDRIIFVGSIVPRNYKWDSMIKGKQIKRVLNECGTWDFLPVLAEKFIIGAGASGALFFEDSYKKVENCRHKGVFHSGLLKPEYCKETWVPFIAENRFHVKKENVGPSWLVKLLDIIIPRVWKLRNIAVFAIAYAVYRIWPSVVP